MIGKDKDVLILGGAVIGVLILLVAVVIAVGGDAPGVIGYGYCPDGTTVQVVVPVDCAEVCSD